MAKNKDAQQKKLREQAEELRKAVGKEGALAAFAKVMAGVMGGTRRQFEVDRKMKGQSVEDPVLGVLRWEAHAWMGVAKVPWLGELNLSVESPDGSPPTGAQRKAFTSFRELCGDGESNVPLRKIVEKEVAAEHRQQRQDVGLKDVNADSEIWLALESSSVEIAADQEEGPGFEVTWQDKDDDALLVTARVINGKLVEVIGL